MLPLMIPMQLEDEWNEDEDLLLLSEVYEMDVSDTQDIDFTYIAENINKTTDDTVRRWEILLKGVGGLPSGKRYNAKKMA